MKSKEIVVLDIGSKMLSAMVGYSKSPSVFVVKSFAEKAYQGFENGEFFDKDSVFEISIGLIKELSKKIKKKRVLHIAVPAEFATIFYQKVLLSFPKTKKIKIKDINELLKKGETYKHEFPYSTMNATVDEVFCDNQKVAFSKVLGYSAENLAGNVSYLLCEDAFRIFFKKVASKAGFSDVKFISSDWAMGVSLMPEEKKHYGYLLMKIGHLSSSASIFRNDALKQLKSFSFGGSHIIANIYDKFRVDFEIAQEIAEKVDLNLHYTDDDFIEISDGKKFNAIEVSKTITEALDILVNTMAVAIEKNGYDMKSRAPLYVSATGIENIRGAIHYIEKAFGKDIIILNANIPAYNKSKYASVDSVLSVAAAFGRKKNGLLHSMLF